MNARRPRFLALLHAGLVAPGEIEDYVESWQAGPGDVQLHVHLGLTWGEYEVWVRDGWLPTAQEHAAERSDAVCVADPDGQPVLLRVHPPVRCRPPCPIHWPSLHPLVAEPISWDGGEGIIRRICRHQILHPDPDDQQVRLHPELGDHPDCDGCCSAVVIDGDFRDQAYAFLAETADPAAELEVPDQVASRLREARRVVGRRRREGDPR